ncbi:MAG: helix-turn-helix domain-containing protein [Alphaproteobacteria bacterium]|nr:helix-turn-helix domain-containing protein [Alphaproteobacteria bacterium]
MLQSDAWRSLSGPAVKVFLELRSRFNGGNNGRLHLSLDEAARLLGIGKATVQRAFNDLESRGFIRMNRRGNWYGRRATEWIVTDCAMDGENATHDWKRWRDEKNNPRSDSEPKGVPDGSATEPKEARRGRYRTDEADAVHADGSESEPLLSPRLSYPSSEEPDDWNPIGRVVVVRAPYGPGSDPYQRQEVYRGIARPQERRDEKKWRAA